MGSQGLATSRHVAGDERVGADDRAIADGNAPQQLGTGTDHHTVTELGHFFDTIYVLGSQGHLLMQHAITADSCPTADDDSVAMAYHQPRPNVGTGRDFDAGEELGEAAEEGRHERDTGRFESTGQPIQEYRLEAVLEQQGVQ